MVEQTDRDYLISMNLTDAQIDAIAEHPQGNLNITELVRVFSSLSSAPNNFTAPQLYTLANRPNGHAILRAIIDDIDALLWMLTTQQIVAVATGSNGRAAIEAVATQGWVLMANADNAPPRPTGRQIPRAA